MGAEILTTKITEAAAADRRDLTGRSKLVANILFTWVGQMVFFTAGFVMPRLIDRKLGSEVLGVWDFSWSLVTYSRFVDMGISSSVNRYVGRFWSQQDIRSINRVASSATVALVSAALVILLGTIIAVTTMPSWFGDHLAGYTTVAQKSVFCLGLMVSVSTGLGAYNGVLTGCHRWELQTMRTTFWQILIVIGMIVALRLGCGLVTLAVITATGQILGQLTLVTIAYRACPGLRLSVSSVEWNTIKQLYSYCSKTLLPTVSELLLNQTTSFLIIGTLGPAALAIFTRPRSLLRQMDSLERKMAYILVPTTSSLEACGKHREIEDLVVKSVRYSIYLVLPIVLVLVIFGGKVMRLWMGPEYANRILMAVLAVGFLGTCIQTPIFSMLSGLNVHGRAGLGQFMGSAISALSVFVALKVFHAGLLGAAVAVTVPLLAVNLMYLPILLCRRVGQNLGAFYRKVAMQPLLYMLPFAACLCLGRVIFESHLIWSALLCLAGIISLTFIYWTKVLPKRLKSTITRYSEKILRVIDIRYRGYTS